jgi:hypothetical protein
MWSTFCIFDTLRQSVLQRKYAWDKTQNIAVHQRNRSAFKRADVRLCRFSARAGGRLGGHYRVPPSRSQAIVPAMDTLLFIGSENGLYIYNITRPDFPQRFSFISHIRSCDPVVASGKYAYVTLNSASTRCNRGTNELLVFDISNPAYPYLQKTVEMSAPKGLGVDEKKLFVCDRGLKIFDISNSANPVWIDDLSKIPEADNIDAYDVIPRNGILLLIGKNGFYQFDYTGEKVKFLSKIEVSHE